MEDVPAIVRYVRENVDYLAPTSPARPPEFLTEAFWEGRVGGSLEDFKQERSFRLFLFPADGGSALLGSVQFNQLMRGPSQSCWVGYNLAERLQGQGLMHEALDASIAWMFGPMHFHRIQAGYMPENVRSGRVLEKLGFVIEALARKYLLINGEWRDLVLTSLVNDAW